MGLFSWLFDRFLRRSRDIPGAGPRDIPGAGPGDKAFLVGINNYTSSPLRGCVNDVHSFKALLLQKYGFKEANVRILLNSNATTKNMTDGLYWLASGAVPGDKRFHHFSGHGTQYPNASEDDGLSEVICPVDFDWSPGKMISDKAYYSIFSSMPKGVVLNWVSDSCHSGDLQRSLSFRARSRFMKPTHEILALLASRRKRIKLARSVTGSFLDVGFVSACRSDQTASDTNIGGTPCGALSWFMVKELRQAASDVPLDKLVESVRRQMSLSAYDQVPQVEGSRSIRPFLMP